MGYMDAPAQHGDTSAQLEFDPIQAQGYSYSSIPQMQPRPPGGHWAMPWRCDQDCGGCLLTCCCFPCAVCYIGDHLGGQIGTTHASCIGLLKCCCASHFWPCSLCFCQDWIGESHRLSSTWKRLVAVQSVAGVATSSRLLRNTWARKVLLFLRCCLIIDPSAVL